MHTLSLTRKIEHQQLTEKTELQETDTYIPSYTTTQPNTTTHRKNSTNKHVHTLYRRHTTQHESLTEKTKVPKEKHVNTLPHKYTTEHKHPPEKIAQTTTLTPSFTDTKINTSTS